MKGVLVGALPPTVAVCQTRSAHVFYSPGPPQPPSLLPPAQASLFSLLGPEVKLVFLPRSGITPQKHTMQLLKYLGLAGRPHSGPLVRLADGGLLLGAGMGA